MYNLDHHHNKKPVNNNKYKHENKNPSFSSTLLDEICRSIDDGDVTTQSKKHNKTPKNREENNVRATLMEKWMASAGGEKGCSQNQSFSRNHHDCDRDQEVMFFSSSSLSSDSSFGGFSSSDTESVYGSRPKSSCFLPYLPKPVKTTRRRQPEVSKKTERKTEKPLFNEYIDDYNYNQVSSTDQNLVMKSKLQALKIYSKVKQPISPGGRLSSFINSLFATAKKTNGCELDKMKINSYQDQSNCSSASSYSRSCLSKNSPTTREKLRNGVKRSVRFVDEGHQKLLIEEKTRKIGKMDSDEVLKLRVEEMKKEFLRDYRYRIENKKRELLKMDVGLSYDHDDDGDDDAGSCSSSDLFELDHLSVMASDDRYLEELPVYETTHVRTNRAIANGFIL